MKLYNFFRSGTSHRLRIALNLTCLVVDYVAVDLRTEQDRAHTFGRAGEDQVARLQVAELGQVGHQFRDVPDQLVDVRLLFRHPSRGR